jgi:gamma-tubulin complex component 2
VADPVQVYAKLMTTMSAFVSYQSSFNAALSKFLADPETESDPAKANQRWTVLSNFERHFNHHTKVSDVSTCRRVVSGLGLGL